MTLWTTLGQLPYRVALCDLDTGSIRRHVSVVLRSDGDFVVEGYECGPEVVSRSDTQVFEWLRVVRAEHLPELLAALGITSATDLVETVRSRYSGPAAVALDELIAATVPSELCVHPAV